MDENDMLVTELDQEMLEQLASDTEGMDPAESLLPAGTSMRVDAGMAGDVVDDWKAEGDMGIGMGYDMGYDKGFGEEGYYTEGMLGAEANPVPLTTKLLSSPVFIGGTGFVALAFGVICGLLLAKKKIKKGIDLYED